MAKELKNPVDALSKAWQKFLVRLESEFKITPEEDWKAIHLLSYFLQRYEEHFRLKFSLSLKGAPGKCTEMFMINKTFLMLNTNNPKIVKNYVDWIYEKKIIPNRLKIRSMGILITPMFVNEYLQQKKKAQILTRSTPVQASYIEIAKELGLQISTYGDLAFMQKALDRDISIKGIDSVKATPIYILLKNLEIVGLNSEKLKNLQD